MTEWELHGMEFGNCNCAYGCPCQFNALPTHGDCRVAFGLKIDRGYHGKTRLDGLRAAGILQWPGPIHEGKGEGLVIIDERADAAQRAALLRIFAGEDTEPGATMFSVFAATIDTLHEPLFAPIVFEIDIDKRQAKLAVANLVETRVEPILNPATGKPHRVRIDMVGGFEYRLAEVARGWSKVTGPISFELADTHSHMTPLNMNQSGILN